MRKFILFGLAKLLLRSKKRRILYKGAKLGMPSLVLLKNRKKAKRKAKRKMRVVK